MTVRQWPANPAPAQELHNCSTTWCAATAAAPNRAATAAAETKHAWNANERANRSRPITACARSTAGSGRHGAPLGNQCPAEQCRGHPLAHQVRQRRAGQFQPRQAQPAVHQHRTQQRADHESGDDVAQWARGVLHTTHPAVAGPTRSGSPARPGSRPATTAGRRRRFITGARDGRDDQAGGQLRTTITITKPTPTASQGGPYVMLADGRLAVTGTVVPGRSRRRAVGQECALRGHQAQDQCTGSRGRPGPPHPADRPRPGRTTGQRFGSQHPQCRQRQGRRWTGSSGRWPAPGPRIRVSQARAAARSRPVDRSVHVESGGEPVAASPNDAATGVRLNALARIDTDQCSGSIS